MTVSSKQRLALAALLAGETVTSAATAAGVTRETCSRWLATEDFRAALVAGETESWQQLSRGLAGAAQLAIDALRAALADDQPMPVRLRAVDLVLSRGPVLADFAHILERLERLERELDDEKQHTIVVGD